MMFNSFHPKPLIDGRALVVQVVRQARRPAVLGNTMIVDAPPKKLDRAALRAPIEHARDTD